MTTHAVEATTGVEHAAHANRGMPTAMVGMLLFIASEVMFFGGLFATYFNARASIARASIAGASRSPTAKRALSPT